MGKKFNTFLTGLIKERSQQEYRNARNCGKGKYWKGKGMDKIAERGDESKTNIHDVFKCVKNGFMKT